MRPHAITFDPSKAMTKQSFKDECDINKIMAKFQKTGVLNHYAAHAPEYLDVPAIDYLDAQLIISSANSMFAELPSSVRKRFNNSPDQFLDFIQDPKNHEEAVKLGLANPLSNPEPNKSPKKRASAPSEPPDGSKPKDVGPPPTDS